MNKNCLLAVLAVAALVSMGCNKTVDESHATSISSNDPVELKLKWHKGEELLQDMEMIQTAEFNVANAPMKQGMTLGMTYRLTVLDESGDGSHKIQLEFLATRMNLDMTGQSISYDSSKRGETDAPNPAGGALGSLVGAKITYEMDASNTVQKVDGIPELIDKMGKAAGGEGVTAQFKGMMNEDYFKQMMSQSRYLPQKMVKPGDTWPVQMDAQMGGAGTVALNFNFTFKNWENHNQHKCVRLDFDGTLKHKGELPTGSMVSIQKMEGTTTGSMWFDPELGTSIDHSIKQDIQMVMSIPVSASKQTAGSQTMTTHMVQGISVKLVSVK